ncbi:MAG: OB-fold nucleic acid binding domain-containing protein [Spirosomataceae bacterium]
MGGIKGTGDAAVESIIEERTQNGPYKDVYDFMTRVNLRTVNKKTLESLVYAGAFDLFGEFHRAQYFTAIDGENQNLIEKLIRYANAVQAEKANTQASLFGGFGNGGADIVKPKAPNVEPWGDIERLRNEKDVVGFYISGHPLDMFRLELDNFCTCTLDRLMATSEMVETTEDDIEIAPVEIGGQPLLFGKDATVAGIVSSLQVRTTKTGKPFCLFKIEDYAGSMEMALFGEDFVKFSAYIEVGRFLFIKGKIQTRWNADDQYEFKISSMQLLSEVREKLTKEVRLRLDLELLDEGLVQKLNKAVAQYPGACALSVSVIDPNSRTEIKLNSRQFRVKPDNELFKLIESIDGITFSVN